MTSFLQFSFSKIEIETPTLTDSFETLVMCKKCKFYVQKVPKNFTKRIIKKEQRMIRKDGLP